MNAGIIETHERGIVTSASLMVRRGAAGEAAAYARRHSRLAVGLHFELGEWEFHEGDWVAAHEVPDGDVGAELTAQLEAFRALMECEPTHLDSHQHAHRREPALDAVLAIGKELGVPVRHFDPRVRFCGSFYGQDDDGEPYPDLITAEALRRIFAGLPDGVTELACHPGYVERGESSYSAEREREIASLCDGSVRKALDEAGVRLISFRDLEVLANG